MTTRKRRRSKVDPFFDQLGEVPDTEIAKLAGVTPENVRAYRKRRGIPARWRGKGQSEGKPTSAPKPTRKAKGRKRRKTKLEPYLDQLGVLPDNRGGSSTRSLTFGPPGWQTACTRGSPR